MSWLARFLNGAALCLLVLASCVGPTILYIQSPRWSLSEAGVEKARTFFVAYESRGPDGATRLDVARRELAPPESDIRYHLPDGSLRYEFPGGDGGAQVLVTTERSGSQLVQVFVIGDTPWSSLSEYRVVDGRILPSRHAQSSPWILLGIVACLALVNPVMKLVKRVTGRLSAAPRTPGA